MGPTYKAFQAPELQKLATEEDWLVVQHLPQRETNGTLQHVLKRNETPKRDYAAFPST